MDQVTSTARSFAKRKFRGTDAMFVEECVAEAYFWLVIIFEEFQDELLESENTVGYVKSKIGYKLREYWAPYSTSTLSYLKKTGQRAPVTVELNDEQFARPNDKLECFICLQSVMKCQLDWDVYEQFLLNKTPKEIGTFLGIKHKRVQKILARIRRRLKLACKKEDDEAVKPQLVKT